MAKQRGYAWTKLRARVLAEERGICALCGEAGATSVDHIVPLCERPDLELVRENLQAAHIGCNSRKEIQRRYPTKRRVW